jgi:chromosomal replication initiation ATPase DnaA
MRSIDQIIAAVEAAARVPQGSTRDTSCRVYEISLARHIACYIARKETHLSFKRIATAFGTDDHKIGLYAFNKISIALLNRDPHVIRVVNEASSPVA